MSNFKRNENNKQKDDTYKAVFGHHDLDAIFQNNLFKGQVIILEEDSPSTIYLQFAKYFIGSSYHSNQTSIIYDIDVNKWKNMIPVKIIKKATIPEFPSSKPESQDKPQDPQNPSSNIAWRYQDMKMQFKLTNMNQSIPFLDLSKNVNDIDDLLLKLVSLEGISTHKQLTQSIIDNYQSTLKSSTDSGCKKLILRNLFHPMNQLEKTNFALFLHGLKVIARSSHMLILILIPSDLQQKEFFMKFCDFYMGVREIFLNKLFSDFQGTLMFEKCGSLTSYNQVTLEMDKWGIKLKGKGQGFDIEQLYETAVQEDDEKQEQSKEQSVLCSSKPSQKDKFDF